MSRNLKKTAFLLFTSLLSGCALFGGGPEITRADGYQFTAPSNWNVTDRAESDRAYRTPAGAFATITSSCNRSSSAPLEVLTRHLLFGERNYKFQERTRIAVDGSEGLLTAIQDDSQGQEIYLLLFVLSKSDCVFDFSLISPKAISVEEKEDYLKFVKSFHYGKN